LNIIEYLFCERLFGKVLLIEKSATEKVQQENHDKKVAAGKVVAEKVHDRKKCGRKS
jgi:hypothetical protein